MAGTGVRSSEECIPCRDIGVCKRCDYFVALPNIRYCALQDDYEDAFTPVQFSGQPCELAGCLMACEQMISFLNRKGENHG